jgi:putative DNA methylase
MTVRSALTEINRTLDEVLAAQEGDFDADTGWAVAWFDQYGFNEGAFGEAEVLCKAKNTSVDGLREAGIVAAKGGRVRLLRMEELANDWDPETDERLTAWEITHYLIRALEAGEQRAASLVARLRSHAEAGRELAYRLYSICERRKRAPEAMRYNTLVITWPTLQELAIQAGKATEGELFKT